MTEQNAESVRTLSETGPLYGSMTPTEPIRPPYPAEGAQLHYYAFVDGTLMRMAATWEQLVAIEKGERPAAQNDSSESAP